MTTWELMHQPCQRGCANHPRHVGSCSDHSGGSERVSGGEQWLEQAFGSGALPDGRTP